MHTLQKKISRYLKKIIGPQYGISTPLVRSLVKPIPAGQVRQRLNSVTDPLPEPHEMLLKSFDQDQHLKIFYENLGAILNSSHFERSQGLVLYCSYGLPSWLLKIVGANCVVGVVPTREQLETAAYQLGYHLNEDLDYLLIDDLDTLSGWPPFDWIVLQPDIDGQWPKSSDIETCTQRLKPGGIIVAANGPVLKAPKPFTLSRPLLNQLDLTLEQGDDRVTVLRYTSEVTPQTTSPPDKLYPHRPLDSKLVDTNYLDRRINGPMQVHSQATPGRRVLALTEYQRLLETLTQPNSKFKAVPLREFQTAHDPNKVIFGIRHDVDLDICGCVPMSQVEKEAGVCSTYFLLHNTDGYYGKYLCGGRFIRFAKMIEIYDQIQANNQEIGLHIDPIGAASLFQVDGRQAMLDEITYLRQQGLRIEGVVGHNSHSVYGADNKDVFAEQNLVHEGAVTNEAGVTVPLGRLHLKDYQLTYVADFYRTVDYKPLAEPYVSSYGFRIERIPVYEFDYEQGFSIVLGGRWEINGADPNIDQTSVLNEAIIDRLEILPPGSKILLNIHPMFYGRRELQN